MHTQTLEKRQQREAATTCLELLRRRATIYPASCEACTAESFRWCQLLLTNAVLAKRTHAVGFAIENHVTGDGEQVGQILQHRHHRYSEKL